MNKPVMLSIVGGSLFLLNTAYAIDFTLSGQVSRMMVLPDDAQGDEVQFQDIGWSGTRFRITGEQKLDSGYSVGFRLEEQLQSNPSFSTSGGGQTDGGNDDFIDNRYQDIYVSGSFGKVALGKGDGASNGSTEADLSGTALSSSSNHQDNWGSYFITGGPDGVTWGSIFRMNDGLSRVNRLRYDTPSFSGLSLAASIGQGGSSELGIVYKAQMLSTNIDARAFFADADDFAADAEIAGFSVSALHASGVNVTVAFSDRNNPNGLDQNASTEKLGYRIGIHAFTLDAGEGETGDAEADTVGLTYAITPAQGLEVFSTYRQLDSDIAQAESVDLLALGSRIKF